jgi:cation:H+ antiporter
MADFSTLTLWQNVLLFAAAGAVIAVAGVRMTRQADILADRTGFGEALVGGVLLGASTSLSGTVTSVAAAAGGHPVFAVSNAIGGIVGQTAFLAIADIVYRRANLEHAAASVTNLIQSAMLILLLSIPLLAGTLPAVAILGIHPATVALILVYAWGVRLASSMRDAPTWQPHDTDRTRHDLPDEADSRRAPGTETLIVQFALLSVGVSIAGWAIAETGLQISKRTGLSESLVGALFTATTTSLPELVTTIAAVRRGALQLAVGGIIGGNTYDVLFLALSDIAYRDGSIYHAINLRAQFWIVLAILMTAVLLLGLLRREKHGIANIGFESATIIALYVGAIAIHAWLG